MEIYNEEARDMLQDDKQEVKIRADRAQGVIVEGLTDKGVQNAQHLRLELMGVGHRRKVCTMQQPNVHARQVSLHQLQFSVQELM
jgi:hypothetical protein